MSIITVMRNIKGGKMKLICDCGKEVELKGKGEDYFGHCSYCKIWYGVLKRSLK